MMGRFIYVFDEASRDLLSQAGFVLLKADENNSLYIFMPAGEALCFDAIPTGVEYATSDTLSF